MSLVGRPYTQALVTRKRDHHSARAALFADTARRHGLPCHVSSCYKLPEPGCSTANTGPSKGVFVPVLRWELPMPRQKSLLEAVRVFHQALGDDAERFLNVDAILKDPELLGQLRTAIEGNFAEDFLPGFQFRNSGRFLWHLKNEQFYRRYLFGLAIPKTHYRDHWIRRHIVPDRFHYITEVAAALQRRGQFSRELARRQGRKPLVRWLPLMEDWLQIRDVDPGLIKVKDRKQHWRGVYTTTTKETYLQWARKAVADRRKRQELDPPNYWQLDTILYNGGQLENVELINQHSAMIATGYLEVWKWVGPDDSPAPRKRRLPFAQPAGPITWAAPDRYTKT